MLPSGRNFLTLWIKDFWQDSYSYWIQGMFELIVMKVEQQNTSVRTLLTMKITRQNNFLFLGEALLFHQKYFCFHYVCKEICIIVWDSATVAIQTLLVSDRHAWNLYIS